MQRKTAQPLVVIKENCITSFITTDSVKDMDLVKIMTHESIVHSQLLSLEKILARELKAELNLNLKGVRSHIIFKATPEEIERVKSDLGYKVYVRHNDEWIYDE